MTVDHWSTWRRKDVLSTEHNCFRSAIFNHACGLVGLWELACGGVQTRCQQLSTKVPEGPACAVSYALPYDTGNVTALFIRRSYGTVDFRTGL